MSKPKSHSSKMPLLGALARLLWRGHFYFPKGHLANQPCTVPTDFFGVGVTSSSEPGYQNYLIDSLKELGVRLVRIDLCTSTDNTLQVELLERLIQSGFHVHLHLLQSFDDAKDIAKNTEKQHAWADFVQALVDTYGQQVAMIEVGATVNRPRWSGYDLEGFIIAWKIAYRIIKRAGLAVAGPNVTDFEPPYTTLFLDALKEAHCLPDIYTNNLFAERATEPERYDHKILGVRFADFIKFNLIKKAKLLHKIAKYYGINHMVSPSSFWTLPRIERYTKQAEDKQADYLLRYFVLLAASNTASKAFWGPLICHREGLIDEGDFAYPALEKITFYAPLQGAIKEFKKRPAFYAYQAVNQWLSNSQFIESYQREGLQIYRFKKDSAFIDVAWAINGLAFKMSDVYHLEDLKNVQIFDRLNQPLDATPAFITEQPILIAWNSSAAPSFPSNKKVNSLHICFQSDKQHYALEDGEWRATIVANGSQQAKQIFEALHPNKIARPDQLNLLRKARNAVWKVENPLDATSSLVAKKPMKSHFHKKLLDYFKPSKAQKSWNSSSELMRREIGVSKPVAFFEHKHDKRFDQNLYISEAVNHIGSTREMFAHFAKGERQYHGVDKRQAYLSLADFLLKMHGRGVLFRDLSSGNVLITKTNRGLDFVLIDTNRAHFSNYPLSIKQRISDLVRICNKLDWDNKKAFMSVYMGSLGKKFTEKHRVAFYLYDFKVNFKRTFGRKGLKKLKRFLVGQK